MQTAPSKFIREPTHLTHYKTLTVHSNNTIQLNKWSHSHGPALPTTVKIQNHLNGSVVVLVHA
jgi:hypothetical protein